MAPLVAADNFKLPGYTTLKLIGSLQLDGQWRLSLDIDNLLDRVYYSSSYMQAWVLPGAGRNYMLSARYRF